MKSFLRLSDRSLGWLIALVAVALLVGNAWSIRRMLASQEGLREASEAFERSQQLASEIARLRYRPRIAALENETTTGLSESIERAMQVVGIPSELKLREDPHDAMTKGDTRYKERLTDLKFDGLSIQQVIQFCQEIEATNQGLTIRDIILLDSNRPNDASAELWTVSLTVSQMIIASVSL